MRMLLDFVPNHTSDRHPWFVDSRASRGAAKRDWYIWRDPAPDGGPPNAWQSRFGGPAWRRDDATGQFAMTSFYPEQVDLNWENAEVRRAVTDAMRRWVERGVDGFRLDVIHRLSKGVEMMNGPRAHEFVREIRDAVGPGTVLLGEVWLLDLAEAVRYLAPGELDLAFAFPFALSAWDAPAMAAVIAEVIDRWGAAGATPCWHIANHDMPRPATRWGERAVRAAAILELALPGTAVLYQGDELGMTDGVVPVELRRDRVGRDPCRTPMRWGAGPNAGFCPPGVTPWLPVGTEPPGANVAAQDGDPGSVLALYRRMLALRRSSPALSEGTFAMIEVGAGHLLFERAHPHERMIAMVNLADDPTDVDLPGGIVVAATDSRRDRTRVAGPTSVLPNEAFVLRADARP
jgi:alpha-glucosidase